MARKSEFYQCNSCGEKVIQWAGVCPSCEKWNTLEVGPLASSKESRVMKLINCSGSNNLRIYDTGCSEINRVLGNGLVEGSLVLLSGEPGIGKSTLTLKILNGLVTNNSKLKVLYVSGEESIGQLYQRAKRLKTLNEKINVLNTSSWQEVLECFQMDFYDVVLIDSIQTIRDEEVSSPQGSGTQVKAITNEVLNNFKAKNITTLMIGHITKDGSIAGPKLLEHMVDTVINFTIGPNDLRNIRATKNRFGSTSEMAQFEMTENGLVKPNDEHYSIEEDLKEMGTSLYFYNKLGRRQLIATQAIAIENRYGCGKRVTQGVDLNRLNLLLAITEKALKIPLSNFDIYLKVSWGIRLDEKEADLAILAAIISSYYNIQISHEKFFSGEVSLGGSVKKTKDPTSITLGKKIFSRANIKNLDDLRIFIKDKGA